MDRLNEFKLKYKLTGHLPCCHACVHRYGNCNTEEPLAFVTLHSYQRTLIRSCDDFEDDGSFKLRDDAEVEWFV